MYVIIDNPKQPDYFERIVPGTNSSWWSWHDRKLFQSIEDAIPVLERLITMGYTNAQIVKNPTDD